MLFLLCIVLQPEGLRANDGLSYYGVYWLTIIPFLAAFILYETALWRAADSLGHTPKTRMLALGIRLAAILAMAVALTPHTFLNGWMDNPHAVIGLVLFLVQLAISIKLLRMGFHWIDAGLVIIELAGGAACAYYSMFEHGWLLQSQAIFQVAFAILVARAFTLLRKDLK